jgi:lipopolysaccharide/colanic/teichoic acid biosynthesis glycosyltransferase
MLDVWYVDNWTIGLDIKILFITVKKVFLREDVRVEGQSSIESFNGHN